MLEHLQTLWLTLRSALFVYRAARKATQPTTERYYILRAFYHAPDFGLLVTISRAPPAEIATRLSQSEAAAKLNGPTSPTSCQTASLSTSRSEPTDHPTIT